MITILVSACTLLLLVSACGAAAGGGGGGRAAHVLAATKAQRGAILEATDTAFFTTTGAAPALRLTRVTVVAAGSVDWARDRFTAASGAPAATGEGLAGGHDGGLLRQSGGGRWIWLGYVAAGAAGCRTAGRSAPSAVARLLSLPPVCPRNTPAPSATPAGPALTGARATTLSTGDLATLLSIFVSTKNSGPAGQVVTPSTVAVSPSTPPVAAAVGGGAEWAMVTYVPASGAPEPLTRMQLQDGQGTAFFAKPRGQQWSLRGFAGAPLCTGAANAHVPPAVLTLWHQPC